MKVIYMETVNTPFIYIEKGTEKELDDGEARLLIELGTVKAIAPKKEKAVVSKTREKAVPKE